MSRQKDADIQAQLLALTDAVRVIATKVDALQPSRSGPLSPVRAGSPVRADSTGPVSPKHPTALTRVLSRVSEGSKSMDEEQELLKQLRPQFYPHTPRARQDQIERIVDTDDEKIRLEGMEGIFNLSGLLLGFAFCYLIARNLHQHGLRFDVDTFLCSGAPRDMALSAVALIPAVLLTCTMFLTEYLFVHDYIGSSAMVALYVVLNALHLVVPVVVSYNTKIAPLAMALVLLVVLILMLKNHSYVATNFAMRLESLALKHEQEQLQLQTEEGGEDGQESEAGGGRGKGKGGRAPAAVEEDGLRRRKPKKKGEGKEEAGDDEEKEEEEEEEEESSESSESGNEINPRRLLRAAVHAATLHTSLQRLQGGSSKGQKKALLQFPNNVRFSQFLYFIFAPTLVYEPLYPRSKGPIRWAYIARKLLEGGLCLAGQIFLMGQFIEPVLAKLGSAGPLAIAMAFGKLAIPVFVTWLLGFYQLFHVHLNVVAELMRFADREFFGQWWSATTIREFWAKWNRPVGELCLRHFYVELTHFTSASKEMAMIVTFAVSAVLHEVIFSVAFKTVRPFFFIGMLAQIPLVILSRGLKGTKRGNLLSVWVHTFLGFSGLMILYSMDWYQTRDKFFCMPMEDGWADAVDATDGVMGPLRLAYAYLTH